jgi:uncharacterized protein (TIGR03437 family)
MVKPHLSLVVLTCLAVAAAVSAQTSYVFQLPGSAQNGLTPSIIGLGDNNFSRKIPFGSATLASASLAGASKVIATPDGTTFYILTPNGVLSANSSLGALSPLNAISGAVADAQVTPDGKYLFVGTSHLYIVNTANGTLAANADTGLPSGSTPVAISFSHDSKTAWILSTANTGSTITTVDLTSLTSLATQLPLSAIGTSMVLSPGNLLYVTTTGNQLYEINPLTLSITPSGQIDVPGNGTPGPLQFTPDGTNAYFTNLIGCNTCSPVFKLNIQSHAFSTWLPTDGTVPPVINQVLVAGNNRVFGVSFASTQLYDITPSPFALTPTTAFNGLPTGNVVAATVSNENPSSRYLYVLISQDHNLYALNLATNHADLVGTLDPINGNILQFVPIPAQSNTAILPLSLSLINQSQTLGTSLTAVLTAQVLDSVGRPVMGATVTFTADPASGIAITEPRVTTTSGGWAETTATTPAVAGNYTVNLTSGTLSAGFALNVTSAASGGGNSQMSIYAGDGQLLLQNTSTAQTGVPLTVKITDASGNPLANVLVTFTVDTADGGIGFVTNTSPVLTDTNGLAKDDYASATIRSNQSFYLTRVHASSIYGDLDFFETTFITVTTSNKEPFSTLRTNSRTISVPQGGILPAGISTQTFTGDNLAIPNIGLRLAYPSNLSANSPGASCVGLSRGDGNGISNCDVYAICQPNIVAPYSFNVVLEVGELLPYTFTINVTGGVASSLKPQPGTQLSQKGNPGNFFTLAAVVSDGCGVPISTSGLTWGILQGSAPAQLVNPQTSSDSGGNISTGVTLGQTAGVVQVQLSGLGLAPVTFNIADVIAVSSINPVLPLPQPVTIGQSFQPLTFKVLNASNLPAPSAPVTFSVSGSSSLSTLSATTDTQGLVHVTVTAGVTPGNIVVTATAGGLSTTVTLVANPVGPMLTTNSFTNAASGAVGMTPCGFVTVTGAGVATGVQGVLAAVSFFGAYPYSLGGLTITVNNELVPIQAVANDQFGQRANFQAPCDLTGSTATVVVNANGAVTTVSNVPVFSVQPGIFTYTGPNNKLYGAVIREVDGTYVTATNPARLGEKVYVVVTGLGQTTPTLITNSAGTGSQNVNLPTAVFLNGQGIPGLSARYLFGWVGAYLVEFQIPSTAATGPDQSLLVIETSADGNTFLGVSKTVLIPAVSAP